jgi:hypothetical protein
MIDKLMMLLSTMEFEVTDQLFDQTGHTYTLNLIDNRNCFSNFDYAMESAYDYC